MICITDVLNLEPQLFYCFIDMRGAGLIFGALKKNLCIYICKGANKSNALNMKNREKTLSIRWFHCFLALFLTSSSLHACNISLFVIPGDIPECPLDQSYETAYANTVPLRLNAVVVIGAGTGSKARNTVSKAQSEQNALSPTFQPSAGILVPEVNSAI